MQCAKHPEHGAAGVCSYSGKPYCKEELVEGEGKFYAKDNLAYVMAELRERAKASPMVFMNAGGGGGAAASSAVGGPFVGTKRRGVAVLLAIVLGGIGAHKFYLGRPLQGLIYLLLCWTGIPILVGWIEAIGYLLTSDAAFARKYG
jgi:TM2 domain-containing membrane protein YozV